MQAVVCQSDSEKKIREQKRPTYKSHPSINQNEGFGFSSQHNSQQTV